MQNPVLLAAEAGAENAPILPHDFNEVIWGSLAFIIVFALIIWKGGPAIKGMWSGRIERFEGELSSAASARAEAESSLADVESRIANAEAERERILAEADRNAEAVRAQLAERAAQDAADVRRRGVADIEAAKAQVAADLSSELADLAVGAAEAVVANSLDQAAKEDLVERYIASVGESR